MFNLNIIFCQWLDSNRGPLISEATTLPTEPQPLHTNRLVLQFELKNIWPFLRKTISDGHLRAYRDKKQCLDRFVFGAEPVLIRAIYK